MFQPPNLKYSGLCMPGAGDPLTPESDRRVPVCARASTVILRRAGPGAAIDPPVCEAAAAVSHAAGARTAEHARRARRVVNFMLTLSSCCSSPIIAQMNQRLPTLYIPHGGGPCFFMDVPPGLPPDMWDRMAAYLRSLDRSLGTRPKAVLVISAHWEAQRPTVNTAQHPSLLFDYYGFPEHTYRLTYPAAGSPQLASRVRELLAGAGIPS